MQQLYSLYVVRLLRQTRKKYLYFSLKSLRAAGKMLHSVTGVTRYCIAKYNVIDYPDPDTTLRQYFDPVPEPDPKEHIKNRIRAKGQRIIFPKVYFLKSKLFV